MNSTKTKRPGWLRGMGGSYQEKKSGTQLGSGKRVETTTKPSTLI